MTAYYVCILKVKVLKEQVCVHSTLCNMYIHTCSTETGLEKRGHVYYSIVNKAIEIFGMYVYTCF